jgi:hypothetical protein
LLLLPYQDGDIFIGCAEASFTTAAGIRICTNVRAMREGRRCCDRRERRQREIVMDQEFTFLTAQAKRCFDLASTCANGAVAEALSQMARTYLEAARELNPEAVNALIIGDDARALS